MAMRFLEVCSPSYRADVPDISLCRKSRKF